MPDPGPLTHVYQSHKLEFRHFTVLIVAGLFLLLLPLGVGLINYYTGYTRYGPAAALTRGLPWLVFAGLAGIVWLVLMIRRLRTPKYKIFCYKNGLSFEGFPQATRALGQKGWLGWDELSGILVDTIGTKPESDHRNQLIADQRATLLLVDGKKVFLHETVGEPGGVIDLPELISRIKAPLYFRLAPQIKSAFAGGNSLTFGPVQISKSGMMINTNQAKNADNPIPWDQVKHLTVQSGFLVIEFTPTHNQTLSMKRFPVSKIPNLELLLQIIKENVES